MLLVFSSQSSILDNSISSVCSSFLLSWSVRFTQASEFRRSEDNRIIGDFPSIPGQLQNSISHKKLPVIFALFD
jgi:hypothetical protein